MFLAELSSSPHTPRELVKLNRLERHAKGILRAEEDQLIQKIREASAIDVEYQSIVRRLLQAWPSDTTGELNQVKTMADRHSVVEGLVMMNCRLIIPRETRREMLRNLHDGPQEIVQTYRTSGYSVWWLSIKKFQTGSRPLVCIHL